RPGPQPLQGRTVAAADTETAPAFQEITPGPMGEGLQIGPEAPGWIVGERAHLLSQFQQDGLGHVLGIGVLQVPRAAPAINVPAITAYEFGPGSLVGRLLAEAGQ